MPKSLSVLIVDDEPEAGEILAALVAEQGHTPTCCRSGVEALQKLQLARPPADVIITDHFMPGSYNGLQLAAMARAKGFRKSIIVTSGHLVSELKAKYEEFSVQGFLPKPYDLELLHTFLFSAQFLPAPTSSLELAGAAR